MLKSSYIVYWTNFFYIKYYLYSRRFVVKYISNMQKSFDIKSKSNYYKIKSLYNKLILRQINILCVNIIIVNIQVVNKIFNIFEACIYCNFIKFYYLYIDYLF